MSTGRSNTAVASGNLLQYKGYLGKVEYDAEAEVFFGEVINTRDVITFQGDCVAICASLLRNLSKITWHFAPSETRNRKSPSQEKSCSGWIRSFTAGSPSKPGSRISA
jgi:predicted HicB family RNase H-like nuclease